MAEHARRGRRTWPGVALTAIVAVALFAAGCSLGSSMLTLESSCLDYLSADQNERSRVLRVEGPKTAIGGRGANPMAFTMVDARCAGSASELSLGEALATFGEPEPTPGPTDGVPPACKDVIFVGTRESGQPDPGHGLTVWRVFQRLEVQANRAGMGIDQRHTTYEAAAVPEILGDFVLAATGRQRYADSIEGGVAELTRFLKATTAACDSQIVLGGYSQGALVTRLAIDNVSGDEELMKRIAGVVLFGDPARSPEDGLVHRGGADENYGVWSGFLGDPGEMRLPNGAAYSWCLPADEVCEFTDAPNVVGSADDLATVADDIFWATVGIPQGVPHGQYIGHVNEAADELAEELWG